MPAITDDMIDTYALKAAHGDDGAFDALRQHYRSSLRGYIISHVLRPINGDDLDDLEQHIWLMVHNLIGEYDPEKGSFYTFVKNRVAKWEALHWNPSRKLTWLEDEEEDVRDALLMDAEGNPDYLLDIESLERVRLDAFHLLIKILFLCGGYPHQQMSFAFLKLIYGTGSKVQGSAAQVIDNHSDTMLCELAREFVVQYKQLSGLNDQEMLRCVESFVPFGKRLSLTVADLMSSDKTSKMQNQHIADVKVSRTALKDYYAEKSQKPTAAVSDWGYGVQKKIMSIIADVDASKSCNRCKLRYTHPCNGQDEPLKDVFASDTESKTAREWLLEADI